MFDFETQGFPVFFYLSLAVFNVLTYKFQLLCAIIF